MRDVMVWSSELLETYNKAAGESRYFIRICGVFRRVSKADYMARSDDATRSDSFHNSTRGPVMRFYKTVYGTH